MRLDANRQVVVLDVAAVHADGPCRGVDDARVVREVLGDLFGHLRDRRGVVEPDADVRDDDAGRLPRDVDHVGAEEETVGNRRRPRVLGDQGGLVPTDLFHEVAADGRLVRAPEPAADGHEVDLLAGGERAHDGEHGAADEIAHQIFGGQTEGQASDASEPEQGLGRQAEHERAADRGAQRAGHDGEPGEHELGARVIDAEPVCENLGEVVVGGHDCDDAAGERVHAAVELLHDRGREEGAHLE